MPKLIDHKGILPSQLKRDAPCTKNISKKTRYSIDSLIDRYMKFLDKARINNEVNKEIMDLAKEKNFFNKDKNFKVENLDQTAFALVKIGRKPIEEGIRIIYAHNDVPCLQIKPVPIRMQWDPDLQPLHLGVEMSVMPYGGAVHYQWFARDCELRGWIVKNGRRRKLKLDVYIPDISTHVDYRGSDEVDQAFSWENIRVIDGSDGEKSLLEFLKFESRIDFSRSKLYIVPKTQTTKIKGDYIAGYGHDDRCCAFTAVDAFLSARALYTTMVIGFDKEEIGSDGDGGAKGNFFEQILGRTIAKARNISLEKVTWGLVQKTIQNSYALSADVDVGASSFEAENNGNLDLKSMGKLGHGALICAYDGAWESNQISATYMDKILTMMNKQRVKIRYQVTGNPHDADNGEGSGSHAEYFTNRGIPTINLGLPVSGLHSHSELIHGGDLYWMKEAYKTFFENKIK
ncbi:MAG: hypothetical protein KKA65_03010 [Nanoarchaeota archaeon]|nr:hypothetical protein [Nanoarchaeota archaeon]MBU4241611.1 hypothetical protein [Nanoarchaeota archaeon]MBU4351824.1 hypothetical protein [Nanoarchaeota archaeon]MBU4456447.1 hypothetical protein [Nanoarchaeota archaeon]MCG2720371.1 hypothetical protein [Nanoarchaeota archaeon]